MDNDIDIDTEEEEDNDDIPAQRWFKPIPGNDEIFISRDKEFQGVNGQSLTLPSGGGDLVLITLYGETVTVSPGWLALLAHFELYLPEPSFKKLLNVQFVPCRIDAMCGNSVGFMPLFKQPVEILHSGKVYRIVAAYCKCAVAADGTVINTFTYKERKPHKRANEQEGESYYLNVHSYNPDRGVRRNLLVHRLVALAWIRIDDSLYTSMYMINHKDGVKSNNQASNLEWCTPLQNNRHAVDNGLRSDAISCRVRDATTGEVHTFLSKALAAAFMGIDKTNMTTKSDNTRAGALIKDRYEFKESDDNTPWMYENRTDIVQKNRYELKITYPDGKVRYIYSRDDARELFGLPKIRKLKNFEDIAIAAQLANPGIKIELVDHYKKVPVQALRHETGEILEEDTVKGMARLVNITTAIVTSCISKGPLSVHSGYSFRDKSDLPWEGDFVRIDEGRGYGVSARDTITGKVLNFSSAREAGRELGKAVIMKLRESKTGTCLYKHWFVSKENGA